MYVIHSYSFIIVLLKLHGTIVGKPIKTLSSIYKTITKYMMNKYETSGQIIIFLLLLPSLASRFYIAVYEPEIGSDSNLRDRHGHRPWSDNGWNSLIESAFICGKLCALRTHWTAGNSWVQTIGNRPNSLVLWANFMHAKSSSIDYFTSLSASHPMVEKLYSCARIHPFP